MLFVALVLRPEALSVPAILCSSTCLKPVPCLTTVAEMKGCVKLCWLCIPVLWGFGSLLPVSVLCFSLYSALAHCRGNTLTTGSTT